MKAFKSTKSKVKEHIAHARKLRPTKSTENTKYWKVSTNDIPSLKKIDDDVWSVEWGGFTTEFSIDITGTPAVQVYPSGERCRCYFSDSEDHRLLLPMKEEKSVVSFYVLEEEVKPMVMMAKKRITKKEGKEAKKKDYYAGKEVKVQ